MLNTLVKRHIITHVGSQNMRRSEMVKLLADALEYHDWKGEPDEMADLILRLLENQGMRPPLPQPIKVIVEKDEPLGIQPTDIWEKEEEPT